MKCSRRATVGGREGFAHVLALLMLAVFATLAVVMAASASSELKKGDNSRQAMETRIAAESGLAFMVHHMRRVRIPAETTEANFLLWVSAALGVRLNGTGALDGQSVSSTSQAVIVPGVALPDGKSFRCWFTRTHKDRCRLTIVGSAHGLERYLSMDLAVEPKLPGAYYYGVASRGRISISGSTRIIGMNYPAEGNIFSATQSESDAIHVQGGGVELSGDLSVSGDEDFITITGTPSIGGSSDPAQMDQHLHFGIDPPDFPTLNLAPLAALATNVLDPEIVTNGGTISNVRIPAGMNPIFNGDVTLNGVVHIEAPNIVKFAGHATINGLIVTDDSNLPLDSCQIIFASTVDAGGVEALPDTEEFAAVKEQTGSFLLAPGFRATVTGNFETINGSIAADQLTFSGTATGMIKGAVIGLKDLPTELAGNVTILVDRSHLDENPAGIYRPVGFNVLPDTYAELTSFHILPVSYSETME